MWAWLRTLLSTEGLARTYTREGFIIVAWRRVKSSPWQDHELQWVYDEGQLCLSCGFDPCPYVRPEE